HSTTCVYANGLNACSFSIPLLRPPPIPTLLPYTTLFRSFSDPASTIPAEEASAPARSQALSSGNAAARQSRVSFPLSAADLPPSPTKSSNLSETAEVPACNVPSRSPLPALAIAPETRLGTASSGLGTLEP